MPGNWIPQANSVFLQALEQPPAERDAFLQQACGEDDVLAAQVRSLLAASEQAGSFLDAPLFESVATTSQSPPERPGAQIGPYKLVEQIGEGGMGTVWMARQSEPVKRLVALKLIKAGMDSRQVIARFEAERQALALMDHPHIARVLDGGTTDAGRPYFVMDLVRGVPITRYCDEHHLTPRQRLELFIPVCQAIQHAHQKGIIHRDLKPSNVLVALSDGIPVPKVIDFGVAKATGQTLTDKTLVTGFGAIVGTLEYMSPEQAETNQLDIDTRSDIYSLGVLLYELLTGGPPFSRNELEKAGMLEMLRVIREQEPSKPSTKLSTADGLPTLAANRGTEPAKLTRLVRGELDWIVMKALEKDRSRRYETANGLARDIERYLHDEPVQACPPSAAYRVSKFARRHRAALTVVGLVLFLLILLGGSIGWGVRDRAATAQQIAAQRAERQARRDQKVTQLLDEIELHYRGGQHSEAMASVRQAEAVQADGETGAELKERIGRWRSDLEMVARLEKIRLERVTLSDDGKLDWSGADRAYAQAFRHYGLDIESSDLEGLKKRLAGVRIAVELAVALDDWTGVRHQLPNSDEASWRRLIAAAEAADPDPLRGQLRRLWGRKVKEAQGDIEQLAASLPGKRLQPTTVVFAGRVLKLAGLTTEAEKVLFEGQEQYPGDFWINFELAAHLTGQPSNKLREAPGFYRAAIAVRPGNALVHSNLGFALARLNRPAEAERSHREAIRLSPNYSYAHVGLGNLFRDQGKWEHAIAAYEDAIRAEPNYTFPCSELVKILTNCPEVGHRDYRRALDVATKAAQLAPSSSWERQNLGWAEYRMGHWQTAIDALEKSCQLQNNGGRGDAFQWFFLAMANQQLGHAKEARRWYDKSFEHTEIWNDEARRVQAEAAELLGIASPPEQFFSSLAEARTHRDASRWQEAIDTYSQAINLSPIQAAITWYSRGKAYLELKQWEPARQDFTRALEIDPELGWVWHARGRALAGMGQLDRAVADFTRALELKPQDYGALGNRGLAHTKLNQLDEAIADFTAAVALAPGRGWLWEGRAAVHAKRGAWEHALADNGRAVQCEPGTDWLWRNYFANCTQAGQWDQAAAECDRALAALPATKTPWQQDSKVFDVVAGRDEIYERLRKLRPTDRTLRIARVKHLIRQGTGSQFNSELAELIDLDPADHWSWYVASILYLEAGAVDDYRRVCREMLRRFQRTPDPFVAQRAAKSCFLAPGAVEDLGAARQLADRATAVHSANQWFHLAQALGEYRAGNCEGAIERLQACLVPAKEFPYLAETAWLVRSMAEHRLHRSAEGRESFAKAQELSDGVPQPPDGLLTEAWMNHRCLDLLYAEAEEVLALGHGDGKAFVLAHGSPAVEQPYLTLAAAALNARDGDTIEVRGNGPFVSKPITLGNKRLTIRAGEGFRPVIQFGINSDANKGALLYTTAALVLEGLELRDGGIAEPPPPSPNVVSSHLAPLYAANCRFLVKDQRAIFYGGGPLCQVRNCEFLGKPLLGFRCDVGQRIVIDNNLLPRAADTPIINVWPPCKDVSIRLTRNCLHGNAAIQFSFHQTPLQATSGDPARVAPVQIESAGNIFDAFHFGTQFGFDLADGIQPEEAKAGLRRFVEWKQQGDLFSLRTTRAAKIRANRKNGERFDAALFSLEDWKQFWGQPEGAVIGGTVRYQGGDLPRRAEVAPEHLTPDDFRLREGSAGYRAGTGGKDIGPDLDIVGPGAGYERWKQTAEYQVWRKDTGQTK